MNNPNLRMCRKIHPVGQGAMYSESFYEGDTLKQVVLYDCGSSSGMEKLNGEIDSLERVDHLFISHFHSDHVNGVERLIQKKGLKKIHIPFVTPQQFMLDFLTNSFEAGAGSDSVRFMGRALQFLAYPRDRRQDGDSQVEFYVSNVLKNRYVILEDDPIHERYWCYEVFKSSCETPGADKVINKVLGVLGVALESAVDKYQSQEWYDGLAAALSDERKYSEAKGVFDKEFRNKHNSYSMIVYSHGICCYHWRRRCPSCDQFDCIYTGDAVLSKDMETARKISNISPAYIQVPHHGSIDNHVPWIYHRCQVAFISAGDKNRYNHPGIGTINDIVNTCRETHIVSESTPAYEVSEEICTCRC